MAVFTNFIRRSLLIASLGLSTQTQAALFYNSWTSNDAFTGNYILSVDHIGSQFSYNLTVSPWNAEALGLFIDLGAVSIGNVGLTSIQPSGQVALFATDTSSDSCGAGCNLSGLALPALAGGDWELVFRLGSQGFDGIQTFSWLTSDFGLDISSFGLVGIRSQQLCSGSDTLPTGDCGGSDKSYGYVATLTPTTTSIPEPGALALFLLALFCALVLQKRPR